MAFLRNEVESLRMIIRRVELQQATGIDVFAQIKELQRKSTAQLEQLMREEEERKRDVSSLRNDFSSRMDGLEQKLEATHQDLHILQFKFKTIVEEIEEIKNSNTYLLENNFSSPYNPTIEISASFLFLCRARVRQGQETGPR